ncbi:hypothetical protein ACFOWU_17280 [Epilithonimonas zeae]
MVTVTPQRWRGTQWSARARSMSGQQVHGSQILMIYISLID